MTDSVPCRALLLSLTLVAACSVPEIDPSPDPAASADSGAELDQQFLHGCRTQQHACSGRCVSNSSTKTCGKRCSPCPAPANGQATCDGSHCGFRCDSGYQRCGSRCIRDNAQCTDCPSGQHICGGRCVSRGSPQSCGGCCSPCPSPAEFGHATCKSDRCGIACDPGYKLCGRACIPAAQTCSSCGPAQHACSGKCVSNSSPGTCGSRCTPCPTPEYGRGTCDGTSCGIACNPGFIACGDRCVVKLAVGIAGCPSQPCADPSTHNCGGTCVANSSPLTCGTSCTPCPAPDNGQATCDGSSCGLVCNAGFFRCGDHCIASGMGCRVQPCADPSKHNCNGQCVPNDSVMTCGASCSPCLAPDNSQATCDGSSCGFVCNDGFFRCNDGCVPSGTSCRIGQCVPGLHVCDGHCVPDESPLTCGTACTPCPAPANGQASCNGTSCGISCNDGFSRCGDECIPAGSPCNLTCGDGFFRCGDRCVPAGTGCRIMQCADPDAHVCNGTCVRNDSPLTCGSSCTPCPAPAGGHATCDGTSCGFVCDEGLARCGDQCIPAGQNCAVCDSGFFRCGDRCVPVGTACRVQPCVGDAHSCNGTCVPNNSPATCGESCTPCPVPANGQATCDGATCGVACDDGFFRCGDSCVPSGTGCRLQPCADPNAHHCNGVCVPSGSPLTCGSSCTPCPVPANGQATCDGTSCGTVCNSGFSPCGAECVPDGTCLMSIL
jgi:hypothetical protein